MTQQTIISKLNQLINQENVLNATLSVFAGILFWIATIGLFGKPVLDDIGFKLAYDSHGGAIGYIKYHLFNTNGRLGDATVTAALYKFFGLNSVPLAGIISVISLLIGAYLFFRSLLGLRGKYLWIATLGSVTSLYFMLWTPYHDFYWLSVVHGYIVEVPLMAIILFVLYQQRWKLPLYAKALLTAALFYAGTFNELFTLAMITSVGLWWLIVNKCSKDSITRHAYIILTLVASFAFLYFAPGAVTRRHDNASGSGNIAAMLSDSLHDTFILLSKTIMQPGLFVVVVIGIIIATSSIHMHNKKEVLLSKYKLLSIFFLILTVTLTFETAFIATYTNSVEGGLPPRRVFVYFTSAMIVALIVSQVYLYQKISHRFRLKDKSVIVLESLPIVILLMFTSFAMPLLKDDAIQLTGRYHLWNQREKEIYRQKVGGDKNPTVQSLPIELLSDLMTERYFYDEYLEKYYGVNSFKLSNPQSKWSREY